MSSPDYYSVVRSDKLEDIISQNSKTSITPKNPHVDIFTPPLKKSAISNYDKIATILGDDSLNNIEKLSQIKQLNFNFNSDFARSQTKHLRPDIPVEKVIESDDSKTE